MHEKSSLHEKARGRKYPGTIIERNFVPDEYVPWSVPYPKYSPVGYTDRKVLAGPVYADPNLWLVCNNDNIR